MDQFSHTVVGAELKAGGPAILVEARALDPEVDVGIQDVFSLTRLSESIEAVAEGMRAAIEAAKPDRATVEFGLDVGVESAGLTALIAKGTGGATLKVTLEWRTGSD